jgi:O-antigen/teichoic acid export membrane protein
VLFQVLAAVVLVVVLRWGVTGVFVATLIAGMLQAILGLALVRGAFQPRFSAHWFATMLKVGLPLVPAALSVWVLNYANRYVLVRYATLADIGVLSVALRISSILLFAISAFETAWGPMAYSVAKNHDVARQTYAKVLIYFLALVMPATAALSIFAREITSVLATPAYASGAALVPLYCFSSVFWVLLYIVGMGTGIAKKTYHSTIATVTAACVNILLNLALIPSHGIVGAAIATVAANFVALVYMYVAGQHYFRVQYPTGKVLALAGLVVVAIVPAVVADRLVVPWHPAVLWVKSGLVMVPFVGLFAFGIVSPTAVMAAARSIRMTAWRS